jgi:hypothetical protein
MTRESRRMFPRAEHHRPGSHAPSQLRGTDRRHPVSMVDEYKLLIRGFAVGMAIALAVALAMIAVVALIVY